MSTHAGRPASQPTPGTVPPGSVWPGGPGRIAPGQRVTCLPGSLPARDGGRGGGVLVSTGPKTSVVDAFGGGRRRIRNELLHPEAGPSIALARQARGLRTTSASGRGWLPGWSWFAYVGAVFTPPHTGAGLAAHAVALFVRYLFHTFPFSKLYMEIPGYNWPQVRSGEDTLFTVEGVLRDHHYYAGQQWHQYLCAIYRDRPPTDTP